MGMRTAETTKGVRVGVLGCGYIATEAHLPALLDAGAEIMAFFDPNPARSENYARRLPGRQASPRWEEVVTHPDVDLVVSSSPPAARLDAVLVALAAGKHVLVEKPMASTLADADRMIEAAAAAGRTLAVVNNFIFYPEVLAIRDLLASGVVGEPRLASFEALGMGQGVVQLNAYGSASTTFFNQPSSELEYAKALDLMQQGWRGRAVTAAGGALMEYGIHVAAVAHEFFQAEAVEVGAVLATLADRSLAGGTGEDYASVTWRFPGGGIAELRFSLFPFDFTPGRLHRRGGMHLLCSEGSITVEYPGQGEGPHGAARRIVARHGGQEVVRAMPEVDFAQRRHAGFRDLFSDLFAAMSTGREPRASARLGRSSFELMLAAYRANAAGCRISLPLPLDDDLYRGGAYALEPGTA